MKTATLTPRFLSVALAAGHPRRCRVRRRWLQLVDFDYRLDCNSAGTRRVGACRTSTSGISVDADRDRDACR